MINILIEYEQDPKFHSLIFRTNTIQQKSLGVWRTEISAHMGKLNQEIHMKRWLKCWNYLARALKSLLSYIAVMVSTYP